MDKLFVLTFKAGFLIGFCTCGLVLTVAVLIAQQL